MTSPEPRLPSPVERALQLFGPATLGNDEWMARYLAAGEKPPTVTPGLIGQQSASSSYDNRLDTLRDINVPCLVVSFELDVLVPAALGQELAAAIPGSAYRCIEGCGHGGLWERSNEANTAIIEFLQQAAATP